jgi:hypothetical protein
MLTDERRAEIERAMQELNDARDAWLKGGSRAAPILIGASRALEMACELLAENDQLRHSIDRLKRPIDSYACQRCGRATGLDVVLTDEKWVAISAAAGNLNLLCLWCVDEIAESLGIKAWVSLFFAGRAIHGTSQSEADEEHVDRLCDRAEKAEAEVTQLNELLASRSELAATTIAGLEVQVERLRAENELLNREAGDYLTGCNQYRAELDALYRLLTCREGSDDYRVYGPGIDPDRRFRSEVEAAMAIRKAAGLDPIFGSPVPLADGGPDA